MANKKIVIKVFGEKEVQQMLKDKNQQAIQNAQIGINHAVLFLETQIKRSIAQGINAPRAFDTGNFMRGTTNKVEKLTGYVLNEVEYGPALEYGTSKMAPRPHFRNTAFVETDKVRKIIADKVKEAIK